MLVYLTLLAFFATPSIAFAWGPGTHLDIALTVLQYGAWVLPALRSLLQTYRDEFIYGSVSPDIVVGKKYAGAIHHCHNWSIGKLILEEAQTDMERAAAWGYLTHLAADCIAHNYFVPYKMIVSYPNRSISHIYWEMRYDLYVPEAYWKQIKHVTQGDYSDFDRLLERVLKKTLFSFKTSKRIFNSILIVQKMRQLRFGLKTYAKASQWELKEKEVKYFRELFFDTVKDFLHHPEEAKCLKADPAGLRKLLYANEMRAQLKRAEQEGVSQKQIQKFIETIRQKLEKGLFDPTITLPSIQDL
ncbi:MAG: hypothetical protein A3H42_03515 [Deltaproteobacteria bacterium RIFCSPLOWO2_02_FULL_46_8]|nr:MAG: hypothetical protein A3H42_03515 [Deltaproteobacteria bacterium RIFCSPLOWO2_02_FULL_46_8]